ncbi:hypothetical protein [Breoghania sp. JC706]|uniref:hypothetical protein n=1 Tax=Breoghania sp. JC706 TaxID=3117732 RepID=UPI00300B2DF6
MRLSEALHIWRHVAAQFRNEGATLMPAVVREVEQALADLQELTIRQESEIERLKAENKALQGRLSDVPQAAQIPIEDRDSNVAPFPIVPRPVPGAADGGGA